MTQYTKPTVLPAWAESAGGADVLQPSNAEIQAGWPLSNVPPSRKRFNWVLKYLAQGVRYILQRGMPEWDAAEDYRVNDRVMGSDGKTYKCIQAGINKDPTTQTAYWTRWGFTLAEYDAEGTTPAQFDYSGKRASTAFVQRALGNMQGCAVLRGAVTLVPADCGKCFSVMNAGNVTLPLYSAVPNGANLLITNASGSSIQVVRQGTDVFYCLVSGSFVSNATALTLHPGEWVLMSAVEQWEAIAGSHLLNHNAGIFGNSKSVNGYQKLPGGLILQWGTVSIAASSVTSVTFPIAFPNAGLVGYASKYDAAANGTQYRWDGSAPEKTQMNIANNWNTAMPGSWLAIGY